MSKSGKVHKVDMFEVTNLNAYPFEGKYTKDGIPRNDRRGDDNTGVNTGAPDQDEKVKGDFQDGAGKSYRVNTIIQ